MLPIGNWVIGLPLLPKRAKKKKVETVPLATNIVKRKCESGHGERVRLWFHRAWVDGDF